jgi:hypothetical protein
MKAGFGSRRGTGVAIGVNDVKDASSAEQKAAIVRRTMRDLVEGI